MGLYAKLVICLGLAFCCYDLVIWYKGERALLFCCHLVDSRIQSPFLQSNSTTIRIEFWYWTREGLSQHTHNTAGSCDMLSVSIAGQFNVQV